jgi:hypothetical protein
MLVREYGYVYTKGKRLQDFSLYEKKKKESNKKNGPMVAKSLKGLLLYMAHEEHDEKWVRVIELVPELQLLMLWQLDRHRMDAGKITMSRRKSGGSGGGGERTKPYNPSRSVPVPFKSYNGRTIQALLDGVLHAGIVRRCVRKANFTHRIEWQDGRVTTEELLPKDKTDKLEGTSSANAWSITAAAAPATRKRKREQEKAKKAKKSKQPKKPKKAKKPDVPTNQSMRLVVNYKRYYGMSQGHGNMVVCKVQLCSVAQYKQTAAAATALDQKAGSAKKVAAAAAAAAAAATPCPEHKQ